MLSLSLSVYNVEVRGHTAWLVRK